MSQSRRAGSAALSFVKNCALLLCLLAPSAWMIATIPPLWRNSDAYLQLTLHPLVTTFWGHGPAYCYLAKIPLFLGGQLEHWQGIAPATGSSMLTDTGVWLLIILQHLALGGAAFYFIRSISNSFWVCLALAILWASNALVYTFAHCTGSETLSVIFLVLLVAKGLRLIQSSRQPHWTDWYLFAVTLCLCLLSRHANVLLILLLPAAFTFSWAHNRVAGLFTSGEKGGQRQRWLGSRQLGQAVIAITIGVASLAVANSWTQYVARKTKLHPHSRIGHTLMWRLQFLKALPPPERQALLQKVTDRTKSADTRRLVTLLEQMHEEGADAVGRPFMLRAAALLFPSAASIPWEKLDLAVNEMAYAFLLPPTPQHWQIVKADFDAALKMSVTEIPSHLFETTGHFFDHPEEMPACTKLYTFRAFTAETINRIPSERAYFQLWRALDYKKVALIWFGGFVAFVAVARWKKVNAAPIAAFALTMIAIGLVMMAFTCLLTEFLPRYALPMWLLLLLSLYILLGNIAHLLVTPRARQLTLHDK